MAERTLQIFAKAPLAGAVKTRMQPWLDAGQAARLQALFTEWTVARLTAREWRSELWCAPHADLAFFRELAQLHSLELQAQPAGDLGAKMQYALQQRLSLGEHVVLVGTDCPALERRHLQAMYDALQQGMQAVVVPAADGGYVALGLRCFSAELFAAIPWGSAAVYDLTRRALDKLGWQWRSLPALRDMDRPEDLQVLLRTSAPGDYLRRLQAIVANRSATIE